MPGFLPLGLRVLSFISVVVTTITWHIKLFKSSSSFSKCTGFFVFYFLKLCIQSKGPKNILSTFHTVKSKWVSYPFSIYLLKVNNRNTRTRCEICSKLTIKTPERRQALSRKRDDEAFYKKKINISGRF